MPEEAARGNPGDAWRANDDGSSLSELHMVSVLYSCHGDLPNGPTCQVLSRLGGLIDKDGNTYWLISFPMSQWKFA